MAAMIDRRWHILGVLFLARTAMGFQFQSVASTATLLIAELHLGYAAIGTLIGLYMGVRHRTWRDRRRDCFSLPDAVAQGYRVSGGGYEPGAVRRV